MRLVKRREYCTGQELPKQWGQFGTTFDDNEGYEVEAMQGSADENYQNRTNHRTSEWKR